MTLRVEKGPGAVMDQHQIRCRRGQALDAVAHGILPLGAAGDRGQKIEAGDRRLVVSPGRRDG